MRAAQQGFLRVPAHAPPGRIHLFRDTKKGHRIGSGPRLTRLPAVGRLVESAVGAHLANATLACDCSLHYWREHYRQVDFVVKAGRRVLAIEVKSGRRREALEGMRAFQSRFRSASTLLVGGDGIALEAFLSRPVTSWMPT